MADDMVFDLDPNIIGPKSKKQWDFMHSEADITVFGGAAGCYVATTEFLTPTGWKRFSEYTEGDLVAQYNQYTNKIQFVQPQAYIKLPCNEVKRIVARGLDFQLSPEHRVPYWTESGEMKVVSYEDMLSQDYSKWKIKTSFESEQEYLHGFDWGFWTEGTKLDPNNWLASQMQLADVANLIQDWSVDYHSDFKENVDFVQYALHSQGYKASISEYCGVYYIAVDHYKTRTDYLDFEHGLPPVTIQTPDGYKYCFTVDTGLLLVRQNDKVFISGNSGKSYVGTMDFLKNVQYPNYRGCMVRRTTPQLKGPGGLQEKAEKLFKLLDPKVRWRDKEHHFLFSNGARVYLRHFENLTDKDNYQG